MLSEMHNLVHVVRHICFDMILGIIAQMVLKPPTCTKIAYGIFIQEKIKMAPIFKMAAKVKTCIYNIVYSLSVIHVYS